MGAWGYKPNDQDHAMDLFHYTVAEPVAKSIHRMMRRRDGREDPHERWARIGVLYEFIRITKLDGEFSADNIAPSIETAIGWLDELKADKEWIGQWDEPVKIRRSISTARRKFARLLQRD